MAEGGPGRPGRWHRPIRLRITVAATLIVEVVLVLGAVLFATVLQTTLTGEVRTAAEQEAAAIAEQVKDGGPSAVALGDDDDRFVQILSDGTVLRATENAESPIAGLAGDGDGDGDGDGRTVRLPDDDAEFTVAVEEEDGSTIVVGRSLESVGDAVAAVTGLLLVAVPLLGVVIAVLTWVVTGRALRPVERLRREVDAIGAAELGHRVATGDDEIGRLADTLNRMLERLDRSQQAQRRFVSDASHELRSPLASLRQYAEVSRDYPDRLGEAELAEAVLDEGARLESLVRSLLLLTQVDERTVTAHPVDLDDLVFAEAARLRTATPLTIDTSAVSARRVAGDEALLSQLLRNLADNAARHASTRIAFGLDAGTLTVDDDGPGVPAADRERVFDRFVRLDEARARDAGGSGLGLAIVRGIAVAHGGTVSIGESPVGGARVAVRLPMDPQSPPRAS